MIAASNWATVLLAYDFQSRICGATYEGNDLAGFVVESMGQLLIVCDQVGNVDVAVVLFGKDVFPYLISAKKIKVRKDEQQDSKMTNLYTKAFSRWKSRMKFTSWS